ncbi:MAG: TldD/PmbA family protein [Burkholderiaceae bacterium]|nr:TldD/PmbA family protein [Burkholderiaceae bacterium]
MHGEGAHPSLGPRYRPALEHVARAARAGEVAAGWLDAECSDFVRFNRARVRQCGTVDRARLELRLIDAGRQAFHTLTLTGEAAVDAAQVDAGFARLRAALADAGPDPHLSFSGVAGRSRTLREARGASIAEICDTVSSASGGCDLVGFYAGGAHACAFASSAGHAHWHETNDWVFDYSVYVEAPDAADGRAIKATIGAQDWSERLVRDSIADSVARSGVLRRPAHRLAPGRHRCWLAPCAVAELIAMLGWGGFSARAHRSGHSPLARLRDGSARFDPRVNLVEDLDALAVARLQSDGFVRPGRVELVRAGRFSDWLASPRSAREFSIEGNFAAGAESPEALAMDPGELDERDALRALDTGVAISNLWYLNFSDREACRVTGMTRFGTVWVEDGVPVAPLEAMRFDDSVYRMLGDALEAIGSSAQRIADTETYERRSFGATSAPGILLRGLDFTL